MTEHKYTDEEIIRALECCYTNDSNDCYKCPYTNECTVEMFCDKKLTKDALGLINRQKAELEDLRQIVFMDRSEAIKNIKAEAVKEFAENIKAYYSNIDKTVGVLINYTIDQKLKEFLEKGGKENG